MGLPCCNKYDTETASITGAVFLCVDKRRTLVFTLINIHKIIQNHDKIKQFLVF